jgi:hypothetical protein
MLDIYRAGEIDLFENLDIVHIRLLVESSVSLTAAELERHQGNMLEISRDAIVSSLSPSLPPSLPLSVVYRGQSRTPGVERLYPRGSELERVTHHLPHLLGAQELVARLKLGRTSQAQSALGARLPITTPCLKKRVSRSAGAPRTARRRSAGTLEDHPLDTHCEPSAPYCWILEILCCTPKGRRALLRIPPTEGQSVCLCWEHSKPKGPKGLAEGLRVEVPHAPCPDALDARAARSIRKLVERVPKGPCIDKARERAGGDAGLVPHPDAGRVDMVEPNVVQETAARFAHHGSFFW